jgi:hypothetical protein
MEYLRDTPDDTPKYSMIGPGGLAKERHDR